MTIEENPTPPTVLSSNTTNSLIHLYRGEVSRMTASRVRLDITTNLAVITTAALTGYAFGPEGHHAVILFSMLATYFFLHVEARRFRDFEVSHLRVRIMERFFYATVLEEHRSHDWMQFLSRDLSRPHVPLDRIAALGWRLRHNYLWIYSAQLIAWVAKLDIESWVPGPGGWLRAASIENVPGWLVLLLVAAFYMLLAALAARAHTYPLEMD